MARISDATPKLTLEGDELLLAEDATSDVNFPIDTLSDFVKDNLTPAETLAKVIASNPEVNGLNANLLQGLAASFFQNASNLTSGTIPDARLPFGEFNTSWSSGGVYPTAGSLRGYWKIPTFLTGGVKIMIQFGWTNFIDPNTSPITVNFLQPFSQGWSTENKPLVGVWPECRGSEWNGGIPSFAGTGANVEMDMRLWYSSLTQFKCSNIRTDGAGTDRVRGNWIALGYYS